MFKKFVRFLLTNVCSDDILYAEQLFEYVLWEEKIMYSQKKNSNFIVTNRSFSVANRSLSVAEILNSSRKAAARRRIMKKVSIISFTLAIAVTVCIIISSIIVKANEHTAINNDIKSFVRIDVEKGDTLWTIAESNISEHYDSIYQYIREIKNLNGLTSDDILYGSKLIIPIYTASTSR